MQDWEKKIFAIKTEKEFNDLAIQVFDYQFNNLPIYQEFCKKIKINPLQIKHYSQIPFLPIEFFKTHTIITENKQKQNIFTSSGTTVGTVSKHFVADLRIYEESFKKSFQMFYGDPENYCLLALLPSYLEREGSSLIYMVEHLIKQSKHPDSGFYLHDYKALMAQLKKLNQNAENVLLIGVTYALSDLAEIFSFPLKNTIIMETGGMKGKRKELVREELHNLLIKSFGVESIHSEYGMTELLSQAYSLGNGIFKTPPWMKILIRDTYDPLSKKQHNQIGGINIIDLANLYSCAFIETKDLGKTFVDNTFTILGRFDNTDIRGCNLMVGE